MTSATVEEIWAILREVAQSQKETDRKFQETERQFKETNLQFKETDRKFQETDQKIQKMTASIGRLGNKLGDFVEEMVRPAAVRLFRERGVDVHEVHRGIEAKRDGDSLEIDLLVVDDTDIIAIECKSTLGVDDVNEHLERLAKVKKLLPTYAGKRVLGAVTGMVIPDNVAQYAYRQGLYVIGQNGEHLEIRNDQRFKPRAW